MRQVATEDHEHLHKRSVLTSSHLNKRSALAPSHLSSCKDNKFYSIFKNYARTFKPKSKFIYKKSIKIHFLAFWHSKIWDLSTNSVSLHPQFRKMVFHLGLTGFDSGMGLCVSMQWDVTYHYNPRWRNIIGETNYALAAWSKYSRSLA